MFPTSRKSWGKGKTKGWDRKETLGEKIPLTQLSTSIVTKTPDETLN